MRYSEALEYLDSFLNTEQIAAWRYPEAFSLDRVRRFLERLGVPQERYPTLHVAGTKGKGSTCAFAASILSAAGLRTGLYTSPHLFTFRERIQVGGEPISEADLAQVVEQIRPAAERDLTTFEVATACAFLHFARRVVDVAVVEVGLGGRLDATNVISPEVTAITPVGLDHVTKLGHSVEGIAREKAGILKPGVPVVLGRQGLKARRVIQQIARLQGSPVHPVDEEVSASGVRLSPAGTEVSFRTPQGDYPAITLPLLGRHQVDNAAAALRMTELFCRRRGGFSLTPASIRFGLAGTRWPGRCQLLEDAGTTWLLDGAQSAGSARALRETVEEIFPGRRVRLIVGVSKDKDLAGMAQAWRGWAESVVTTQAKVPRAEPARLLAEIFAPAGKGPPPQATPSVADALQRVRRQALDRFNRGQAGRGDLVVVTGSLFVVAEALQRLFRRFTRNRKAPAIAEDTGITAQRSENASASSRPI